MIVALALVLVPAQIDFRAVPVVLDGHESAVMMVQFAPDSKRLFSASSSELVGWNGGQKERVVEVAGPVAVSGDGEQIAAASIDSLTLMAGKAVSKMIEGIDYFGLPSGDILCQLSFSQDGRRLAVAGFQKKAVVVTLLGDTKVPITLSGGPAECMALSPNGTLLVAGDENGGVGVYNADTGAAIKTLKAFAKTTSCIAFSRDGKLVAAGGEDGGVKIWKTSDWSEVRSFSAKGLVFAVAFSADATKLAYTFNVGPQQSAIEIIEIEGGKSISRAEKLNYWVFALAFSPDGSKLAAGCEDGAVRIWSRFTP